jgi:phosphorylcholine metabolism protein LicD
MHEYHYTIDKRLHQIQSIDKIDLADANGCIQISKEQNKICKQLKALLCEWIRFTKENKIHWNAMAGTLLGIVRDHGLIFYDNDIDVAISYDDMERVDTIMSKINSKYDLRRIEYGYQLSFKNKMYPFIDVFLLNDDPFDKTRVIYTDRLNMYGVHIIFPKEHFAKVDIINSKQALYEGILCNVPANTELYIKQIYGNDALTRYVQWDISLEHNSKLANLTMYTSEARVILDEYIYKTWCTLPNYINLTLTKQIMYNIASNNRVDFKIISEFICRFIEINIQKYIMGGC